MPAWWVAFTGSRTTYIRSLRIQLSNLLLSLVSFGLGQDEHVRSCCGPRYSILLLPGNSSCCAAMVILPAPPHDPPTPVTA